MFTFYYLPLSYIRIPILEHRRLRIGVHIEYEIVLGDLKLRFIRLFFEFNLAPEDVAIPTLCRRHCILMTRLLLLLLELILF